MKKPRQHLKLITPDPQYTKPDEFRNCSHPGCPNIVSIKEQGGAYSGGPIYCLLHRSR